MGKEAEHSETVVDGHEDHALACPGLRVELRLGTPAFAVTAAVDPESHRELGVGLARSRSPDVEVETVFTVRGLGAIAPLGGVAALIVNRLVAGMSEPVADLHSLPRNHRLRCLPPEFVNRRCRIRDATVNVHTFTLRKYALNLSAFNGEDRILRCRIAAYERRQREDCRQYLFHTLLCLVC